jgi:hypothetical protein
MSHLVFGLYISLMKGETKVNKIKKMLLGVGILFLLCYPITGVQGQSFSADAQGNYFNKNHIYWSVSDQTGLNVRTGPALLKMLQTPRSQWKGVDPKTWSAHWQLPYEYMIQAKPVQGSVMLVDVRGNPWLIADLGSGRIGVVRANSNFITPPFWQEPIQTESNGDYSTSACRTQHVYWEVVDPDPVGLNQRMLPTYAREYDSVEGDFPSLPVSKWPIVGSVRKGTILRSAPQNLGLICPQDSNGSTWILLRLKPSDTWKNHDSVGFVRANIKYIRPIAGPVMKP